MSGAALHWRGSPAPGATRLSAAEVLALVSDPMQAVEARLLAQMDSPMGRIPEVGGHLLGAGGKRLRPLLAVLAVCHRLWTLPRRGGRPRPPGHFACTTFL